MDTHSVEMPLPGTEAMRRVVDHVLTGEDAVLSGSNLAALLDEVREVLAYRRCRVLRASAQAAGGLSLSGLMAQVTGRPDLDGHDDEVLERGFQALTAPDADCDVIVLLVDGADVLQRTTLRYLQFTCRSAPALRLVLAGEAGLPDLHEDEMAYLRTRLASSPVIVVAAGVPEMPLMAPGASAAPARLADPVPLPPSKPQLVAASGPAVALVPGAAGFASVLLPSGFGDAVPARSAPAAAQPEPARTKQRLPIGWIGAGLGMAASVALGVVIGRLGWSDRPGATVSPAPQASAVQAVPSTPVAGAPTPDAAAPRHSVARPGVAAVPGGDAGQAAAAAPAPSPVQPLASQAAMLPTGPASSEGAATQPPAASFHAGLPPAAQPDLAPAHPRPVAVRRLPEIRLKEASREPVASARTAPPSRPSSRAQALDSRERGPAVSGREATYAQPDPPVWQLPAPPSAPWGGERRPIIGRFTTDENGVRTFRSFP